MHVGMKPLRVLGIMSGTSLDGTDYAVYRISRARVVLLDHWHIPFPKGVRDRLRQAACDEATSHEIGRLHHQLGRFYARGASRGMGNHNVDAVGLHGQTIFHEPNPRSPATLQIGEPAWLVEALGVPVVSNFRGGDLAAGGQGAPLATLLHKVVFGQRGQHVCVNNLGGISNVTSLDWSSGGEPALLSFDTGPANMLMDLAVRHYSEGRRQYDRDGRLAARGRVNEDLVRSWLRHPFFRRRPPKSTGREEFGEVFWQRVRKGCDRAGLGREDVLASLTALTARSIARSYARHLPSFPRRVVLCGGGAENPALVKAIHVALNEGGEGVRLSTSAQSGWPAQAIEPAAFALLAAYRLWNVPPGIEATTGARGSALLGQVARP